jgi:hypothetical protein
MDVAALYLQVIRNVVDGVRVRTRAGLQAGFFVFMIFCFVFAGGLQHRAAG